jgi:hypothetical protein
MRIPSPANQLGRIAAQEAAGSAAAAKPAATAAQAAAPNASALQARPPRVGAQGVLNQPRRQNIAAKLAAELQKHGLAGGLQPRPQIQSASQILAQAHGVGAPGVPPIRLQIRPQIQTAAQMLAEHGGALPSARPLAQAPVTVPPHGAGPRPDAAALFQSLLPGGPTFPHAAQAPVHHAASPAPDAAALFQSLLPGGPTFPPAAQAPVHHAAASAPDAAALFQSLLPGGPTFPPAAQAPVHHAAAGAPDAAALFQSLLPGGPTFAPAAPFAAAAQVVHQPVHIDPQSLAPAHTPAQAAPAQSAAPTAAAKLADDRFAAERLSANAPPATAKFQKTTGMMAQYDGEQTGKVWGTKVAYLDEQQRQQYKLTVHNGKIYDAKGELFDTASAATVLGGGKAIFVMDHDGNMYASTAHAVGKFHHSSFLAGQPVAAAGEIEVHNGEVTVVNRKSGHYRPTESQLNQVAEHLSSLGLSNFAIDQKV